MNELEEVKQSLAQIAKSNAEAAAWRAEAEERAEKWRAERDAAQKSLEKEVEKMVKTVHNVCKEVGGMSQTQGRVTEEFFYQALSKAPWIGGLKFGYVRANVKSTHRGEQAEYDLLMMNGEVVAVIEVKHKLRRTDVERMRDVTLPGFRRFLPEYNDKKLAPAVACMTADDDALALAHKCGYAVLAPSGRKVCADTSHLRLLAKRM